MFIFEERWEILNRETERLRKKSGKLNENEGLVRVRSANHYTKGLQCRFFGYKFKIVSQKKSGPSRELRDQALG
jgi:hypothetical protein